MYVGFTRVFLCNGFLGCHNFATSDFTRVSAHARVCVCMCVCVCVCVRARARACLCVWGGGWGGGGGTALQPLLQNGISYWLDIKSFSSLRSWKQMFSRRVCAACRDVQQCSILPDSTKAAYFWGSFVLYVVVVFILFWHFVGFFVWFCLSFCFQGFRFVVVCAFIGLVHTHILATQSPNGQTDQSWVN